jgi:hypothetical protein
MCPRTVQKAVVKILTQNRGDRELGKVVPYYGGEYLGGGGHRASAGARQEANLEAVHHDVSNRLVL